MEKVPVTIYLSREAAERYERLPDDQKRALGETVEESLTTNEASQRFHLKARVYAGFGFSADRVQSVEQSLKNETMTELLDRMHSEARHNGLTPDILEELLQDDDQ